LALCGSSRLASSVDELAETPNAALVIPIQRRVPKHISKPQALRLPPIENCLDDIARQVSGRSRQIGVGHASLGRGVGDLPAAGALIRSRRSRLRRRHRGILRRASLGGMHLDDKTP
jgi:hypothetical protein